MKKYLIALIIFPLFALAHGGDDHGAEKKATIASAKYFSSSAISEKYELLLKYGEIEPGVKATYKLFISNYVTNQPIDSAQLVISVNEKKRY